MIYNLLIPFGPFLGSANWMFLQDSGSIMCLNITFNGLKRNKSCFVWSSRSTDGKCFAHLKLQNQCLY